MAGDTPKKEKKDKKRKSDAAGLATDEPVAPIPVPPAQGTASAEAVVAEVDAEKAAKKAKKEKKEKRKSVAGGEEDEKVCSVVVSVLCDLHRDGLAPNLSYRRNSLSRQMPFRPSPTLSPSANCRKSYSGRLKKHPRLVSSSEVSKRLSRR